MRGLEWTTIEAVRKRTRQSSDGQRYPEGWDRKRAQAIASYYENQSDAHAIAEAEAAYASTTSTMMQVPIELVPQVQKLIRRRAS